MKNSSSRRKTRRAHPVIWRFQPTKIRWIRGAKKIDEWQRKLEEYVGMGVLKVNREAVSPSGGRGSEIEAARIRVIATSCAETWCGGKPNGAPDDCGYD